jgi:hypothetical protein
MGHRSTSAPGLFLVAIQFVTRVRFPVAIHAFCPGPFPAATRFDQDLSQEATPSNCPVFGIEAASSMGECLGTSVS